MKNPASVWRLSEWQVSPFDSKKFDTNEQEERLPEYAKASWPQTQVTASRWMTKFMAVSLTLIFLGACYVDDLSRCARRCGGCSGGFGCAFVSRGKGCAATAVYV
jgi:hypothetical protein